MWIAITLAVVTAVTAVGVLTLRRSPHRASRALAVVGAVPAVLVVVASATGSYLAAAALVAVAVAALGASIGVRRAFADRRLAPSERALFLAAGWDHVAEYPAHLGDMFTSPGQVVVAVRPRNEWSDLTTWAGMLPANAAEMHLVAVLDEPTATSSTAAGRDVTLVSPATLGTVTARRTTHRRPRANRRPPTDRRPPKRPRTKPAATSDPKRSRRS